MAGPATSTSSTARASSVAHALEGAWRNEMGSILRLEVDGAGGLRGSYRSGAGSVAGSTFPLSGCYDPSPAGPATVLGFVVDWTDAHSVTVWAGQHHTREQVIRATWLMSAETGDSDEWKSTFVGHDTFRRDEPEDLRPGG